MGYRFVRPRKAERRIQSDSYFAGPWGILMFVGIMVAAGFGVIALIRKSYESAEGNKSEASAKGGIPLKGKPSGTQGGWSEQPASGNKKVNTPPPPPPPKTTIGQVLNELNVAVVAKEVARYKGDAAGAGRQATVAVAAAERLQGMGGGQGDLPEHFEPSDQIVAVDNEELEPMRSDDAAARLSKVLRTEVGNSYFRFRIRRSGQMRDVQVYISRESSAGAAEFSSSGRIKISTYLGLEIQKQVLSLPVSVLPQSERVEIEKILGRGEATPEEYAMLTRRLALNESGQIDQERESFKSQITILVKMLGTGPVPDVLQTKDGRKIVGTLSADTQRAVIMETSYAKVEVLRPNVQHLFVAQELRDEFENRLKGSQGNLQGLITLLAWTRDNQMPVHREYVAYLILQLSPSDPVARQAAGYYQGPGAKWVLGTSIAGGAKPETKKPQNRGELQVELETMGFALQNGHWYSKTPWTVAIDTLHSPIPSAIKMSMSGCQIFTAYEGDTPEARLTNPSGKPKDGSPPRLRFIGSTGPTGSVTLTIEAPDDLYECKVKALGHVVDRFQKGKVECYITPEGTSTQTLYQTDGAADELFHDVTSLVRGKRRFALTVRLTTTMDKFQTYARFLPSVPGDREVLSVRATILQPAPDLDKTWAGMRP